MIIVRIKHVNYNGTVRKDKYFFKSNDDLKCNDYVNCDTRFGCILGIVCDVYKTIDELIESNITINFADLKECSSVLKELELEVKNENA